MFSLEVVETNPMLILLQCNDHGLCADDRLSPMDYSVLVDVRTRAEERLGRALPKCHEVREVRKVSPKKDQFCLSFDLPLSVIMQTNPAIHAEDLEPASKKLKRAA